MSGVSCAAPLLDTAMVVLVVLAGLVPACGGKRLDLGYEGSNPAPVTLPPRTADGGLDETTPWAIAPHQGAAEFLAIDATRLYWSSAWGYDSTRVTSLNTCVLDDCQATMSAYPTDSTSRVTAIAVNSTRIYWVRSSSNDLNGPLPGIRSCPIVGCRTEMQELGSMFGDVVYSDSLVADDSYFYWLAQDSTLQRCPISGCAAKPELVGVLSANLVALAADDTNLFVTTVDFVSGEVVTVPKDGSSPVRVIAGAQHKPGSLAVGGGTVYWADFSTAGTGWQVLACPISGCMGKPAVIATSLGPVPQLAADERNVYWIEQSDDLSNVDYLGDIRSTVVECPKTGCGGAPKILAAFQGLMIDLVLDATHVYWSAYGPKFIGPGYVDGSVYRVGK